MFLFHRQTNGKVVCHLTRKRGIHPGRKRELASARYVECGLTGAGDEMAVAGWGE